MPLAAQLATQLSVIYTIIGIFVGGFAVSVIFVRGARAVYRFVRRGEQLLDRLETMLDTWEGKPVVIGGPPQPSIPARVLTLETAVSALQKRSRPEEIL
jgi:uncharacterized membrane protein YdjX (TVP38/TMEM64 family)